MADARIQARLKEFQIVQSEVDLSRPRHTSHGKYWYNLHIVLKYADGWREVRENVLRSTREMILKIGRAKRHLVSRGGLAPDHVHLTVGGRLEETPLDVGLSYMNNLASLHDMRPVFRFSCYLGTFGEYDLGAVR